MQVSIAVDVDPDCPPYLTGFRGIEQGMERLVSLLSQEAVRGTFFTTGDIARRYPAVVRELVDRGHELGCHGDTHRAFDALDARTAAAEIVGASATLRQFAAVTSFRAPYLRFPDPYLGILRESGYRLDSSQTRYKRPRGRRGVGDGVTRVPASTTSSVLRLPRPLRHMMLRPR